MSEFRVVQRQTKQVEKISHVPLDPPRGVRYVGGIVKWEPPQETRNVTHYRIYKNTEYTLICQVPLGQTEFRERIVADRLFISCYNASTNRESRKVMLGEAISEGETKALIFGIPGTLVVGNDVTPHADVRMVPAGSAKRFRCLFATMNTKDETTSVVKIDLRYSYESSCVSLADRVWTGMFPTSTGDLTLTVRCPQTDSPLTIFRAIPLEFRERTLVRCDVKQTGGRTAAVVQVLGVVKEVD